MTFILITLGTLGIQKSFFYTLSFKFSAVITLTAAVSVYMNFSGFIETNRFDYCIAFSSRDITFFHCNCYIEKNFVIACHISASVCAWLPGPIWTDGSNIKIDAFYLVFHLNFHF